MRYVRFRQLAELGLPWSRTHVNRLIAAGEFPAPIHIGRNTVMWLETEILDYLEQRRRERDTGCPRRRRRADDAA